MGVICRFDRSDCSSPKRSSSPCISGCQNGKIYGCSQLVYCANTLWIQIMEMEMLNAFSLQRPSSMRGSIYGSLHTALTSWSQRNVESGGHASIELDEQTTSATGVGEAGNVEGHMQDGGLWDAMHPRSGGKSAPPEA